MLIMTNPLVSILITTYECHGKGAEFIRVHLESIAQQTYRPIEVIVSDHSRDDAVQAAVEGMNMRGVTLRYVRYTEHYGNPCHNWNNAAKYANGDFIKYAALDDPFSSANAVQALVDCMAANPSKQWIVSAHYTVPANYKFSPKWNPEILTRNTVSGPSAAFLRRSLLHVQFDPQFSWLLDLDWYYRLYKEAGQPAICQEVTWINNTHPFQLSSTVNDTAVRQLEADRMKKKYGDPLPLAP